MSVGTVSLDDDRTTPVAWDFIDEMPGADARQALALVLDAARDRDPSGQRRADQWGSVLRRSRTPGDLHAGVSRCFGGDPFDRAAELIAVESMKAARALLPPDQEMILYKDNSDRKGNAYGTHENYLLDRSLPFGQIINGATIHFVTRQIFSGSGKVGSELPDRRRDRLPDHPTSRALRRRGRARDHAQAPDRQHARRAPRRQPALPSAPRHRRRCQHVPGRHVPEGRYHAIVFAMLEDHAYDRSPTFLDPVRAMHHVSHDLSLREPMTTGRRHDGHRARDSSSTCSNRPGPGPTVRPCVGRW